MEKIGIYTIITPEDEIFPKELLKLKDVPQKLYCLGNLEFLNKRKVAVVGSRKISSYGKWASLMVGEKISRCGITVVSGMARGIDTYAHEGALKDCGKTIAVLGCGIDRCYPAENWKIKDRIAREGLVISEYPPGMSPSRWSFPKRNRIIAALSEMVVVAEAGLNSGALITAELAMDLGKEVMAIPGNINNIHNMGSNRLIADGAIPIVVIDDVLQNLGVCDEKFLEEINLSYEEKEILKIIRDRGELSVEKICEALNKKPSYINGIITILEMKGVVYTSLGKVFVAK